MHQHHIALINSAQLVLVPNIEQSIIGVIFQSAQLRTNYMTKNNLTNVSTIKKKCNMELNTFVFELHLHIIYVM